MPAAITRTDEARMCRDGRYSRRRAGTEASRSRPPIRPGLEPCPITSDRVTSPSPWRAAPSGAAPDSDSSERDPAFRDAARPIGLRLVRAAILALALVAPMLATRPAQAELRIGIGDVIEVSIMGFPDLRQRLTVQADGFVSGSYIGSIEVAGLTSAALRAKLQTASIGKPIRQRLADGQVVSVLIEPDDLAVAVVEHRPIYVSGDVGKPGEYPYRAELTVARALALAGGLDTRRLLNQSAAPWDVEAELDSSWMEMAKERARLQRAKSILGTKNDGEADPLAGAPIGKAAIADIQKTSAKLEEIEAADYQKERASFDRSLDTLDKQIAVLTKQLREEELGTKADMDEFENVRALYAKGTATAQRVADARRSVLLSSTRSLQTSSELLQTRKQREDVARQLERLDDHRRLAAHREIESSRLRIAQLRSRLGGLQKLLMSGADPGRIAALPQFKPRFALIRRTDAASRRHLVDEDAILEPGDVLTVGVDVGERVVASTP